VERLRLCRLSKPGSICSSTMPSRSPLQQWPPPPCSCGSAAPRWARPTRRPLPFREGQQSCLLDQAPHAFRLALDRGAQSPRAGKAPQAHPPAPTARTARRPHSPEGIKAAPRPLPAAEPPPDRSKMAAAAATARSPTKSMISARSGHLAWPAASDCESEVGRSNLSGRANHGRQRV